jgi:lipoprotein-releasing system permease protein
LRDIYHSLPILIGLRYFRARQRNRFVSFISLISTLGLILGVAVLIVVLSIMNGFERELRSRILGVIPHGTISAWEPISEWQSLIDQVESHPEVNAAAPYISGSALLAASGLVEGVTFTGIIPRYEQDVSIISEFVSDDGWQKLAGAPYGIIIGLPLMQKLGLKVGEKVSLVLPQATVTLAGLIPRMKRFTLIGSFEVGADVDKNLVLINLGDAARLLRLGNKVQGIRIATADLFRTTTVLREVLASLEGRQYKANSWKRMYGNLYEAIQMQKTTMFLLLILIVAVAAFNVVSSLIMMVSEKKADIAILRTLGASSNTIMGIFIFYGTMIGVVGVVLGVSVGLLVATWIGDLFSWFDQLTQLKIMSQYFINYLPSQILLSDVATISAITLVICFVATLYPAYKAAMSNPAEALSYE